MQYFYVYILKCRDGSYYTGHTDNIEKRISEHKLGKCAGYTSTRLPVEVVYVHTFPTRYEALVMERRIKSWGRKKKEALINGDWSKLQELAKNYTENKREV